ncbi:MAG TPA: hypothetical protein V6C85_15405 [Allocoleopsis sp.]
MQRIGNEMYGFCGDQSSKLCNSVRSSVKVIITALVVGTCKQFAAHLTTKIAQRLSRQAIAALIPPR